MQLMSKLSVLGTLVIATGIAAVGMSASGQIRVIDGSNVYGGSDKFVCKNLCTQTAGPGCVASDPIVNCLTSPLNTVCGETITEVFTVNGCVKDDAGAVNPCENDQAEEKCYKAKNCVCKIVRFNGRCDPQTPVTSRGSANGSSNCP